MQHEKWLARIWIWRLFTILVINCHSYDTTFQHKNEMDVAFSVESSARGAAVNLTCLSKECRPKSWTSFVNEQPSYSPEYGINFLPSAQSWWEPGKDDGIVLQEIHEITKSVLITKVFNTWYAFTYAAEMSWWLDQTKPGRIIVMTVRRSGTYGLSPALRTLAGYGSVLAPFAPAHALWIWIFVKGGKTILECVIDNPFPLKTSLATLHGHASLQNSSMFKAVHEHVHVVHARICNTYPALKSVCEYNSFLKMAQGSSATPQLQGGFKINSELIGILVCAGGSIQHLAYTLQSLLNCSLVSKSIIFVAVGTDRRTGIPNSAIISLLTILHLPYKIIQLPLSATSINHHLFQYYKNAWIAAVEAFPKAKYIAFLDEDVEVSRDWLDFLLHSAPVLERDPTVWCVTGVVAHRFLHPDPHIILRALQQPGWGFLLLAKDVKAAIALWPDTSTVSVLYDNFIYQVVGQGRECIYPVVNRARHYGVGVNTLPQLHQLYFLDHVLHSGEKVMLPPPETLVLSMYEERVKAQLKRAIPLARNPCAPGFLIPPPSESGRDFVFYFYLDNLKFAPEWATLAECIGAWPYSTQGMHQGCAELPQAWGGSLWLVGVPYSPYSYYKPPHIPVWHPNNTDEFFEEQSEFIASISLPVNLPNRTFAFGMSDLLQKSKFSEDGTE
ncbi:hypothetical protein SK128_022842 [Halocaridina rubra]|uniref:Alpha-1,3-mannosyl-glycoprotein 2-beta-N-acetylglucosaminyltransferase n=1 Tax=Halocaridina rubra TaxID=373956 RepID=A0AAN9AEL1_HALRR